jgi:regulatory protein
MTARSVALRLLARRDYTSTELRAKLLERDIEAADVEAVVGSLTEERLLDDRRVAAAHARTASQIKHRGRLRIRRELEARGIDRASITEVLDELPEADEASGIDLFLRRRRAPLPLDAAGRRRLFNQLMRRGFSADAISKALRTYGQDEE